MDLDYEINRLKNMKSGKLLDATHIECNVQEFCINCDQSLLYLTKDNPSLKPCCAMYLTFCSVIHFVDINPAKMIRSVNSNVPVQIMYYLHDTYRTPGVRHASTMPYTEQDVITAFSD